MSDKIPPMSEKDFERQVIQLAKLLGWRVAHFRPAMNRRGKWQTPVAADGAGFPDLVLVRDRLIFIELKREGGKLSKAQVEWQVALRWAGCEEYTFYPSGWKAIEEVLTASG
jgi:hypothetical protein